MKILKRELPFIFVVVIILGLLHLAIQEGVRRQIEVDKMYLVGAERCYQNPDGALCDFVPSEYLEAVKKTK